MRLQNKVAIITGGGAGMGRAMAERFAHEGARVVIAEINAVDGEATAAAICARGGEAIFVRADVSQAADVAGMVGAAMEQYGGVDILVNNAAVQLHGKDARAHELPEEIWDRTYSVNSKGVWLCAKHTLPALLRRGGGAIVNIASPTGLVGCAPGYTAYSSSKAAVFGLTRVMAADYARDNIRVNAIVPGAIDTPLIAELLADPEIRARLNAGNLIGRIGRPDEVASLAVFLASDEAAYCTGGFYMVDGGLTAT
jgi:NAD(P)-dependent dehydrogenase (short-subunit alcohol dehydrogenase family)